MAYSIIPHFERRVQRGNLDRLKDRIYSRAILLALVRDGSLPFTEAHANLAGMIERRSRSPVDRLDELI